MKTIEGIVILAAIDWKFLKQRPQHLAEGFAKRGLQVLFVENTGVRSPRLSDFRRLWGRVQNALTTRRFKEKGGCGHRIEVFSPLAVPLPYSSWAGAYNARFVGRRIQTFLTRHRLGAEQVVLLSYMATPLALSLADGFPWGTVIYDVVSDPKKVEPRLAQTERRFLRRADLTLFASASLRDAYGVLATKPVLFRDGYSLDLLAEPGEIASEIRGLPCPRFLYLGGLNHKVWAECLTRLADTYPESSVILVGPQDSSDTNLPARPNIFVFPPRKHYSELAGILHACDAGLIPYRPDHYAGMMHPAKLNEYLVFGLPVVGVKTAELERIRDEFGANIFYLAESPDGFAAVARDAVVEDTPTLRQGRRAVAKHHAWDRRVGKLLNLIGGAGEARPSQQAEVLPG